MRTLPLIACSLLVPLAVALTSFAQPATAQAAAQPAGEAQRAESVQAAAPMGRAEIAREIALRERAVALAVPGTRACRRMTVGIATHDRIAGSVVALEGAQLRLRIDDAGRHLHRIGGAAVREGAVLRDALEHWEPCAAVR